MEGFKPGVSSPNILDGWMDGQYVQVPAKNPMPIIDRAKTPYKIP
jgi:hypothetical protein